MNLDYPFYVYVLTRPCGSPFYVGKGTGERFTAHLQPHDVKYGKNSHKTRIIQKIIADGGTVGVVFDSFHRKEESAFEREKSLILEIGRVDLKTGPLTNKRAGGEGNIPGPETRRKIGEKSKGRKHSEETKAKISAVHKGRKHSATQIENRAATRRGRKLTAEHREKLAAAKRGKKQSPEHVANRFASLRSNRVGK